MERFTADDLFNRNLGMWVSGNVGRDGIQDEIAAFLRGWSHIVQVAESPIELLFGASLLFASSGYGCVKCDPPGGADGFGTIIGGQVPVGSYRVDFLFTSCLREHRKYLVVECDGHDFHEKTKEQAARDKARDRYFATLGMAVMRFTGSEIWADSFGCTEQVEDVLNRNAEDLMRVEGVLT